MANLPTNKLIELMRKCATEMKRSGDAIDDEIDSRSLNDIDFDEKQMRRIAKTNREIGSGCQQAAETIERLLDRVRAAEWMVAAQSDGDDGMGCISEEQAAELVTAEVERRRKETETELECEALRVQVAAVRSAITEWTSKSGQNVCHWHPDILKCIAGALGVPVPASHVGLPPRAEFEAGCTREQDEIYGKKEKHDGGS